MMNQPWVVELNCKQNDNLHSRVISTAFGVNRDIYYTTFLSGFQMVLTKWQTFVQISNGWAGRFQIQFKIQTVCYPTSFPPIEIQTSPDFISHCTTMLLCTKRVEFNFIFQFNRNWQEPEQRFDLGLWGKTFSVGPDSLLSVRAGSFSRQRVWRPSGFRSQTRFKF